MNSMCRRFCSNTNEYTGLLKETICGTEVKKNDKICYPVLPYKDFVGTWICKFFMPSSTHVNSPISNQPP